MIEIQALYDFIDTHREEMISLWGKLVNTDSGSAYKAGVDRVCGMLREECESIGMKTRVIEWERAGNTLVAVWGEDRPKKPIVLLGHMDTVFAEGEAARRPFTIKDGIAKGPGALDMKAGCVIALYLIKALAAVGYDDRPIKCVFSGDEEVGHKNSDGGQIFLAECTNCAAAFDFETSFEPNQFIVGRKGSLLYTMETFGVAAHSGNFFERGRNAIMEAAYKMTEINALTNLQEGYTINVGVIQGGTVSNAVPDYCKVEISARVINVAQGEMLTKRIEDICTKTFIDGVKTKLVSRRSIPPMETTQGVMKLFGHVAESSRLMGLAPAEATTTGGGSDAAWAVIAGIPTLCATGVKGGLNHSEDEFAIVESMFERAKLFAVSILQLTEDI